jgi:hypothetical protein
VKNRPFLACFIIALLALWGSFSESFEIQFPGETGFFIGKSMIYEITEDSNEENKGKQGVFTFGQDQIVIDGAEYYNSVFESPTGDSHFYLDIDSVRHFLVQKGFELTSGKLMVDPAVAAVRYPLASGDSWSESNIDMRVEGLEISGLALPNTNVNVQATTRVSAQTIQVPAGTFDTLLVENTFSGSLIGLRMILIQRTWLNPDNVPIKRSFVLLNPAQLINPDEIILYEIQLSETTPTPYDLNWDGKVNILDVVVVAKHFNLRPDRQMIPNPDVNGDGVVDLDDIVEVAKNFDTR